MWKLREETSYESETVRTFIEFGLSWLRDHGYTLGVDVDMTRWAQLLHDAPANPLVNPTFDPRFNRLSANNCFWLDVRVGTRSIATSAARLFVTGDYLSLKRSMKLWYDVPTATLPVRVPKVFPTIAGRVGHEGGLWVHPAHRKKGLSTILPHLNRALCLREWDIDWQTGATGRGIAESRLPEQAYGFPHVVPCFEGYFPVMQREERVYITYMNRSELLLGLDVQTVANLLPDRDRQMRYAVAEV